jgi:assimilatory nitrate reductase catalytic subunit
MDGTAPPVSTRTTCPYCGVGCGVLVTDTASGVSVTGDPDHPANFGRLCSKGAALGETLALTDRLLHPEIRGERVDWDTALDAVAKGFADTIRAHGPDTVAFYVSGQLLTEDYYVANKLIKGFLGTANIDTNSRLCMASSVAGHRRAFGADVVPGNYEDLELADLVVLVGSNLAWCHPVLFQRIIAARKARPALKLVVIDPRRTMTAAEADLHLPLRSGSDAILFNGLLRHLSATGLRDDRFLERHAHGADMALSATTSLGSIEALATACDLNPLDVEKFFRLFAERERVVTVYSQGVNQSSSGTDKVNAIINCHLLTGRIGRPGMGPFSVTGQPNAMGGREVGALANQLAAHMDFVAEDRSRVQRFWGSSNLAARPGLKAVDLFRAVGSGQIKAVWIMATNPVVSVPDGDAVRAALEACPLVVVSDGSLTAETARYATIRLPALLWSERDGTVTNSERRISRQRPFRPAPGEARPDWWIISQVATRLGFGAAFAYRSSADIFREHAALSGFENEGGRAFDIGALATLDDAAYDALAPVQWPHRATGDGPTARLFDRGGYFHPDKRASLLPIAARPPVHQPDADFPWILNTGRVRDQWHTMTRTAIPRLMVHVPEPFLAIHPIDADEAGLSDGDLARVTSRWGEALLRVQVSDAQKPGEVFAPMHWSWPHATNSAINRVVNPATDPQSGQPELKHTPISVSRFAPSWQGVLMALEPVETGEFAYRAAIPGEGFWCYELADTSSLADGWARIKALFSDARWSRLELRDPSGGRYRAVWSIDDRPVACLVLATTDKLPARQVMADLLLAGEGRGLIAGGRGGLASAQGATICVCHGVTETRIVDAIKAGAQTVEAVGAACRAGTNCGSCIPELRRIIADASVRVS